MEARDPVYAQSQQNAMDQFDLFHRAISNRALSTAGLAIGSGSKAKVLIANTVTFLVDGVFKSKTTAEVAFTATTHDISADADTIQERYYVLCLAADGTPSLVAGAQADSGEGKLPEWEDISSSVAPIGYVKIAIAAGSTPFDASTDLLDAGHITDTYVNLGFLAPKFSAAQ
jgi:hypothetical protein